MLMPTTVERFHLVEDEDARAERRRRKRLERAAEDRALDPWERYRALADHCDALLDVTELYDRKTRFALLILGGLNALNLLVVARTDLLTSLESGSSLVAAYAGCYALLSLCLLVYAIAALKPRTPGRAAAGPTGPDAGNPALRLIDGARDQTLQDYCEGWRRAQIGEITRELAVVAFARTRANAAKLHALHRVYTGLYVLVAVTAALFVGLALGRL